MVSNVLNELRNQLFTCQNLKRVKADLLSELDIANNRIAEEENAIKEQIEASTYYKRAVDLIYEKSVKELKDTLNSALSYIYFDRDFKIDVELSDKRGKSLSLVMYNNGEVVSLKRGMGKGVNCAISAILLLYYLNCKGKRVLLLDESYSNLSEEYVEQFFDFFKKLVKQLGFKVVFITHDPRFLGYADKVYTVNCGEVSCEHFC